jgi:hypothetical protein
MSFIFNPLSHNGNYNYRLLLNMNSHSFHYIVVLPYRRFLFFHFFLKAGTDMLSRNVGKKLPLLAA